jgi:hypothetical protein
MVSAPCRDTSVAEVEPLPRPSQGRGEPIPYGLSVMLGWPTCYARMARPTALQPLPGPPRKGREKSCEKRCMGGLLHSYILHLTTGRSACADFFGSRVPYYIIYFIISLLLKSEDDKTICKVVRCKVVRTGSTAHPEKRHGQKIGSITNRAVYLHETLQSQKIFSGNFAVR